MMNVEDNQNKNKKVSKSRTEAEKAAQLIDTAVQKHLDTAGLFDQAAERSSECGNKEEARQHRAKAEEYRRKAEELPKQLKA
jgi:hypothetical protein